MSRHRLIAVFLVLIAAGAAWSWWQSDRRQIERQVNRLQEAVSKSGPESSLEALANARTVAGVFAPVFEVHARQLDFETRNHQELTRFVHQYRSGSDSIHMRVVSHSLNVVPEHQRATLDATFEFPSGGPLGRANEAYHVQVNWLHEDGEWRIDYVDLVEILERASL